MNTMKKYFSVVMIVTLALLDVYGTADAQRRNDRDVRDALRNHNSKIDDLEYNLRYQMQTTSRSNAQVSQAMDDIRDLRDATKDFEDNLYRRRENGDDVERIIAAAQQIEQTLARLEQSYANRPVKDIRRTYFTVVPQRGGYTFAVTRQTYFR